MKLSYAKDVFLSFVLQIFENGRSLLLIPVIAKTLGASGYGIWVQVKIGIAFLCPFLLLGIGGGISRFFPGSSKNEIRNGIFSSIVFAVTTGAGLAILILFSKVKLQKIIGLLPDSKLFIEGLALLCIAEPLNNISLDYFKAFRKIKILLSFSILDTFFEFSPVFWFVYNGFGIGTVIFSFACGRFFMAVVKNLSIFTKIGIGTFKINQIVRYIKFGLPLIWATLFFYISNYLDRYLIGFFYSVKEVGVYSFAYSIGYLVVLISAPWERILVPTITAKWNEGQYNEVKEYFEKSIRYMLLTIMPVIIFVSILAKKIIISLSTAEFMSSKFIIPIMLISFFLFQGGVYYGNIVKLAYKDAPGLIMKVFLLLAATSLFLNIIIIPRFSIFGAAAVMFFVYFLMFIIFFILAQKKIAIKIGLSFLVKSIIATIPGCVILLFFNKGGVFALIFKISAALLLYLVILLIVGIIGRKEYLFITTMFNSKKTTANIKCQI